MKKFKFYILFLVVVGFLLSSSLSVRAAFDDVSWAENSNGTTANGTGCVQKENVEQNITLGTGSGGGSSLQQGGSTTTEEIKKETTTQTSATITGTTGGTSSTVTETVEPTEKGWDIQDKVVISGILGEFYDKIKDDIAGYEQNLVKPGSGQSLAQDENLKMNWAWVDNYIDTDRYQEIYEGELTDNVEIKIESVGDSEDYSIDTITIIKYDEWEEVENTERFAYYSRRDYTRTEWWFYNMTNSDWQSENGNEYVLMRTLEPNSSCVVTLGKKDNEAGIWSVMSVPYFNITKYYEALYVREYTYTVWVWATDENGDPVYDANGNNVYVPEEREDKEEKWFVSKREPILNVQGEPTFYQVTVPTVCMECPDLNICVGPGCEDDCDTPNMKCDDAYYEEMEVEVEYEFSGSLTN